MILVEGTKLEFGDGRVSAASPWRRWPSMANAFLVDINKQPGVRPHRPALLSACLRTLHSCSDVEKFHELAIAVREQQRVIGREIKGRAVGSTLLLKGLEADVAVLLDTSTFSAQDPLRGIDTWGPKNSGLLGNKLVATEEMTSRIGPA